MIKCQQCGQFIKTGPGEKCPNCGSTKRFIGEKVSEKLGFIDAVNNIFERISIKKLLINLFFILLSASLGFFFAGIQGVIIAFFVGVIIFLKAPPFREKRTD